MEGRYSIAIAVLGIGLAGCADAAAPEGTPTSVVTPLVVEGPRRAVAAVSWPQTKPNQEAFAALNNASKTATRRSPIPVLVPSGQTIASALTVMAEAHWYAASSRADGLTLNVSATEIVFHVPGVEPAVGPEDLRGTRGFVTQNEGIWSATWIENGASYVATVECENHDDARCASASFVRSLVADLVYVGGKGAEGAR